jgi:hypothetical protein
MFISNARDFKAAPANAEIVAAIKQVSEADLRGWVKWLSVPRHFFAQPEVNREVAAWIAGLFKDWGYDVSLQGPFYNVVALPRKPASELLLVGAHFDSVSTTPGADDNASAVAAMLGCAKLCASIPSAQNVCFVAFNREEDNLAGSRDFVENYLPKAAFRPTMAHVLEMVGYASSEPGTQRIPEKLPIRIPDTGDFLALLANRDSARQADTVLATARSYLPDFPAMNLKVALGIERFFPVLARSDHAPFWEAGIPSIMWTDTSEFRNPHYHLPSDTPETLNYQFLANVTRLLCAHLLSAR